MGIERKDTPGAKAPFVMLQEGAKPEGLAYLEACSRFRANLPLVPLRAMNVAPAIKDEVAVNPAEAGSLAA